MPNFNNNDIINALAVLTAAVGHNQADSLTGGVSTSPSIQVQSALRNRLKTHFSRNKKYKHATTHSLLPAPSRV